MIKENARFLLSYNKSVIMFTVANQKAIAFHFPPRTLWVRAGAAVQSAYSTLGVYFIWQRIQSELWPYVNAQQILICRLSSACFYGLLMWKGTIFHIREQEASKSVFSPVYSNKDIKQRGEKKTLEYLQSIEGHTLCLWSTYCWLIIDYTYCSISPHLINVTYWRGINTDPGCKKRCAQLHTLYFLFCLHYLGWLILAMVLISHAHLPFPIVESRLSLREKKRCMITRMS